MAAFDYKILTNLTPIAAPSASLFVNAAATASYARSILLHNVSSSMQTVNLWLIPSGAATTPMEDKYRFLNVGISGSSTFIMEFGNPGLMVTQSDASIWGSCTNDKGINVLIYGGQE